MKRNKAKRDDAKQKAARAIDTIVRAAKELAKAEQAYYGHKAKTPRKPAVLAGGGTCV